MRVTELTIATRGSVWVPVEWEVAASKRLELQASRHAVTYIITFFGSIMPVYYVAAQDHNDQTS